ncbi:type II toxin-antitoxin system HicB family antitoxin [Spirulina major]|uniref:type II toxin-antitoxin system HicB family antitoxin n=1 Tax=Spirulina major TaxID=270636 RepID=UPI00093511C7|nr:type II toxin-antitoxin system HicB family antitoxin [Spirulina major]
MNYTLTIQWSTDDQCFVVFLPDFADTVLQPVTHGETYETALKNAHEVIQLLIETAQTEGTSLPHPQTA